MAIDISDLTFAKPEPRKRTKARRKRDERAVVQDVRSQVASRDGYCRCYWFDRETRHQVWALLGPCAGRSEWAHLRKRWETRGMAPEDRHDRRTSIMLCNRHHQDDAAGFDRHAFEIEPVTERGADGPLRFIRLDGQVWDEPS